MIGCILRGHSGIDKADEIGEPTIAEEQMHPRFVFSYDKCVTGVPAPSTCRCSLLWRVKWKSSERREHLRRSPSTRCPAQASFNAPQRRFLRRPQAFRANPEQRLVRVERAPDLERSVVRMAETPRRSASLATTLRHIGIAQQRQNRMVERRRRKLDAAALHGVSVSRQTLARISRSLA